MNKKEYAFCKVSISPLRKENSDTSEMVSQLLFGELVDILEKQNNWTKITTFYDNYEAWTDTKHLIPLNEEEFKLHSENLSMQSEIWREIETPWGKQSIVRGSFIPFTNSLQFNIGQHHFNFLGQTSKTTYTLETFAKTYLNTPYLWGGKSPFGIDCSGFTQQVFRYFNKKISRDAYQQAEHGSAIAFENSQEGDLAFFQNSSGKITHVGIILNHSEIIHASGYVKIDVLKKDGIYSKESNEKTHDLSLINRLII